MVTWGDAVPSTLLALSTWYLSRKAKDVQTRVDTSAAITQTAQNSHSARIIKEVSDARGLSAEGYGKILERIDRLERQAVEGLRNDEIIIRNLKSQAETTGTPWVNEITVIK